MPRGCPFGIHLATVFPDSAPSTELKSVYIKTNIQRVYCAVFRVFNDIRMQLYNHMSSYIYKPKCKQTKGTDKQNGTWFEFSLRFINLMKAMISHLSVVTIKDQPKSVIIENQAYLFVPMTKYEIPLKTIKHFSPSVKSHYCITLYVVETYLFLLFHILYAHFDTFAYSVR